MTSEGTFVVNFHLEYEYTLRKCFLQYRKLLGIEGVRAIYWRCRRELALIYARMASVTDVMHSDEDTACVRSYVYNYRGDKQRSSMCFFRTVYGTCLLVHTEGPYKIPVKQVKIRMY